MSQTASDHQFYIEDVIREQLGAMAREALIKDTAAADKAQFGHVETWVEQEPGGSGKGDAEATIRNLRGYDVHAERPTGEKLVRARPYSAQCEGGNVWLKRGMWNGAYIDELAACPGKYMDQVDASSGAFDKLAGAPKRKMSGAAAGKRPMVAGYQPR